MRLKLLVNRCLLTCVAALATVAASAYDFEEGGIYYNISSTTDKTVSVTYLNKENTNGWDEYNTADGAYTGDISVPEQITYNGTTYNVTTIGDHAFENCTGLQSIELPEGITELGIYAFWSAKSLESISLPKSILKLGNYVFGRCESLTEITLPDGIPTIPDHAFRGSSALKSLKIPDSVTSIGFQAFYGCTNLKSIEMPQGLSVIENMAFTYCSALESIYIPEGVSSIDFSTFMMCTSLTEIHIPNNVKQIGNQAFYGCSSLAHVEIGTGIKSIDRCAFQDCRNLKSFTVLAVEPPTATENTFDTQHYSTVGLTVPYESIEDYRTAPVWENFFKMQDNPLTGIEGVEAQGDNEVVGCYDLYGRSVTEDYRGVIIVRHADGTTSKEVRR